jgi:ABC-2 type transport system permease protein
VLRQIIHHELRLLRADRATLIISSLFAAALVYAIFNGSGRVREEKAALERYLTAHKALVEKYRKRAEAIERVEAGGSAGAFNLHKNEFTWGPKQPAYVPAWAPFFAALPPSSAAALAVGQSDIYPSVVTVSAVDRELRPSVQPSGNPMALLLGSIDLAFVILFLYPLFIVALSFDLVAGEREQGTLTLLLAQPVSLKTLLAGKVTARAILVLGTTLTAAATGFLLTGIVTAGTDALPRLLLWFVGVPLYGAFWLGLAIWINSLGKTSAFNVLALVGSWLSLTIIVPALLMFFVDWLYPLPSRGELVELQRAADFEAADRRNRASPEDIDRLIERFIQNNPQLQQAGAWNENGQTYLMSYAQRHEVANLVRTDPAAQRQADQQLRRETLQKWLSFLSPALLMQATVYDIAGVGPARYKHFLGEAARYQGEFEAFLWPRLFTGATLESTEFKDFPRFQYREEPLGAVAGRIAGPFAVLLSLIVCLWYLAMGAQNKCPSVDSGR